MPILVSCPSCARQLRVPDDLLGRSVKCPDCGTTFQAAAEGPAAAVPAPAQAVLPETFDPEGRPIVSSQAATRARDRIVVPAVLLLVWGGVAVVLGLLQAMGGLGISQQDPDQLRAQLIRQAENDPNRPRGANGQPEPLRPEEKEALEKGAELLHQFAPAMIGHGGLAALIGLLALLAGFRMLSLKNYGLVMFASIVVLIPCTSPFLCCAFLGSPVGLWAVIALSNAEVRQAFS
jgi:predicted Zn finger-like uncharacterized protein